MEKLHYDVLIAGAGPAGIAAALAAARSGAHTALLERYGCVGGGITQFYVRPFLGWTENRQIGFEIEQRCNAYTDFMSPVESAKIALPQMLKEAGVDVFLQTVLTAAERVGSNISSVTAHSRSGDIVFTADAYIDATGDGELSFLSGAEIRYGRDRDGLLQPASVMFTIDGIEDPDMDLICEYELDHQIMSDGRDYLELCRKACEDGILPSNINIVRLYKTGRVGERMVNATQANYVNVLDPRAVADAELLLREQVLTVTKFLRETVPGFRNIRVSGSAFTLGVRESRRVMGDYVLCAQDLIDGRQFDDAVVHNANFCIDIHNPDGPGQAEDNVDAYRAQNYDIPYRCLCPRGIDNLLTAGRCISGTHEAHASYRVMRICMGMGHAAGAAAAQMHEKQCRSRDIDISAVQKAVGII